MLVLLVIVILALPHARPWAHKVSLRNSHSLLYVTKEAHFFPSLNSSLTTLNSTPANFPHDVIIPVFSSPSSDHLKSPPVNKIHPVFVIFVSPF